MSHSIHILSIQIDTKSLKLVIYHQFNNIKLSFFTSHVKSSFHYVRLMDAVRLLDTLKYTSYCLSKTNEGLLSQFYPTWGKLQSNLLILLFLSYDWHQISAYVFCTLKLYLYDTWLDSRHRLGSSSLKILENSIRQSLR